MPVCPWRPVPARGRHRFGTGAGQLHHGADMTCSCARVQAGPAAGAGFIVPGPRRARSRDRKIARSLPISTPLPGDSAVEARELQVTEAITYRCVAQLPQGLFLSRKAACRRPGANLSATPDLAQSLTLT